MSRLGNAATTAAGLALGATAAAAGFLLTTRAIQNHRYPPPAKPYNQADQIVTNLTKMKGAQP